MHIFFFLFIDWFILFYLLLFVIDVLVYISSYVFVYLSTRISNYRSSKINGVIEIQRQIWGRQIYLEIIETHFEIKEGPYFT